MKAQITLIAIYLALVSNICLPANEQYSIATLMKVNQVSPTQLASTGNHVLLSQQKQNIINNKSDSLPQSFSKDWLDKFRNENGKKLIPAEPETDALQRKVFNGQNSSEAFGQSLSSAGDVNGDGYQDIIVGAYGYNSNTGRAYIYFGGPTLDTVADVTLTGETVNSSFGVYVSSAGDVNNDGYSDVIVGAWQYSSFKGRAYIYYGGASMNNVVDVTLTGEATNNNFGISVSSAGDVNNDGYSDVIVGAQGYNSNTGRAYVFLGGASMDNNADVTMNGESTSNIFGASVSSAGDVNGDGFSDVVIGAYGYSSYRGRAYVFYGGASMNNSVDVTMTGEATNNSFGTSVSSGDINGDGFSDVIVGAFEYSSSTGRAYIFYGAASMDNVADVTMTGEGINNYFGISVSTANDLNGDGYIDVIVGANANNSGTGKAYVFFGGATMNNIADIQMTGEASSNYFGASVSNAGDFNGDGNPDFIVGAWNYNSGKGRVYLFEYVTQGQVVSDIRLDGEAFGNGFGTVASAGDVNNDGFDDVIVGAQYYNGNTGRAYIYFGGQYMNSIADVILNGEVADDNFGRSVSSAGDVNNDGYDDVIVGAPGNYGNGIGKAYIFLGGAAMNNIPDVIMNGQNPGGAFGWCVSSAGKVNGDAYSDVIVGAPFANEGRAYIFFGGASMNNSVDVTMSGEAQNDLFGFSVSTAGDIYDDGYDDVVVGAPFYDYYPGGADQGRCYVFFGGISMDGITDGTLDPYYPYLGAFQRFGMSVASGNINGDNFSDLIIGAPGQFGFGKVYIFSGYWAPIGLIYGEEYGDRFGNSVSSAKDLNGDGYGEIIVGADGYGSDSGKAYVYYGINGYMTTYGPPEITIAGEGTDYLGYTVSAGEVNGDTLPDFIVGATGHNSTTGSAHIIHGSYIVPPEKRSFRTIKSGPWDSKSTWQMSTNNGTTWTPATSIPNNLNSDIYISNSHTINVTKNDSARVVIVEYGAQLIIDSLVTFRMSSPISLNSLLAIRGIVSGKGTLKLDKEVILDLTYGLGLNVNCLITSNVLCFGGNCVVNETLTIDTLGYLYIYGSTSMQLNKTVTNNGTIFVSFSTFKLSYPGTPLINNGTLITDNGIIEYDGTSPQILTSNLSYGDFKINNPADVSVPVDLSIPGKLSIVNGDLNLNGKTITLGDTARLIETPGNTIKGSGSITITKNINHPNSLDVGGLGLVISSAENFGQTTITRVNASQNVAPGKPSIKRYYDITTQNNTALNCNMVFKYDQSEIDTLKENSFGLFKSTNSGANYTSEGGSVDTVNNSISINHLQSFSRWTAGRNSSVMQPTNDSVVVANIYMLGRFPERWNSGNVRDTIKARIRRVILPEADSITINYMIKDRVTFQTITDSNFVIPPIHGLDTIINILLPRLHHGNYEVVVQSLPGILDPINGYDVTTYCFDVTCDNYNHINFCDTISSAIGVSGNIGRFSAAFKTLSTNPADSFLIYAIDGSFKDTVGNKPYKFAIYLDNNGKPGTRIYLSPALTSPAGNGTVKSVTHNINPPIVIPPNTRFHIAYYQSSPLNLKVSAQDEIPVRKNSFFFSLDTNSTTWYDFSDSSKNYRFDISPRTAPQLKLKTYLEGFYNTLANSMISDTVALQVHSSGSPYNLIKEDRRIVDDSGKGIFYFANINRDSSYFLVLHHRNHIETWSHYSAGVFTDCDYTYNFTDSISKAFGDNLKQEGAKYCVFAGDVNQDKVVDATDIIDVYNAATAVTVGYVNTDLTGDNFVDVEDVIITFNNSVSVVSVISP